MFGWEPGKETETREGRRDGERDGGRERERKEEREEVLPVKTFALKWSYFDNKIMGSRHTLIYSSLYYQLPIVTQT